MLAPAGVRSVPAREKRGPRQAAAAGRGRPGPAERAALGLGRSRSAGHRLQPSVGRSPGRARDPGAARSQRPGGARERSPARAR